MRLSLEPGGRFAASLLYGFPPSSKPSPLNPVLKRDLLGTICFHEFAVKDGGVTVQRVLFVQRAFNPVQFIFNP
jgi:hypothetical protein